MAVIITSLHAEKEFTSNKILTVGSSERNDFCVSAQDFELILEYNETDNTYSVINNSGSVPYFKGKPFKRLEVSNVARLLFPNSDEFINIKVVQNIQNAGNDKNEAESFGLFDLQDRQDVVNAKLDDAKKKIESRRVAIISQISQKVSDLSKRLSQNLKGSIFTHFALFLSALVCAFAVTNYISGLSIQESANYLHLPTDLKIWFVYTVLVLGTLLLLKQGMFGYFFSKTVGNQPKMSKSAQIVLCVSSLIIMTGVYVINLIYYLDYTKNIVFPVLISMFFVGIALSMAVLSAYYKCNGCELSELLNKYEYREDFEKVLKDYQLWVGMYVNNLSEARKNYISEKMFRLRIKEFFETVIGLLTAPFLAFGVSNTLALCFPEAAGWVRISGLRFSPVFLVLASFLIIFAFFLFVHAFATYKKISNSDVIKHDGFSNYLLHCAEIMGLEATSRTKKEMSFAFCSALVIVLIEFTMNVSYFSTEIGQDFYGLFLSLMAALVPTALLVAETFLLGGTKFQIYALEEIFAKADK